MVETLVAISIFTVSILALLSLLADSIADTNYAKKKIVASYLAQEGIEYMRNLRDTYVLFDATDSQTGWNSFVAKLLGNGCDDNNGCYFDDQNLDYGSTQQPMISITVSACGAACPPLLYDEATGKYGYGFGVNQGFTRKIEAVDISSNEMKILSTVLWTRGSGQYSITLSENLFKWAE